MIVRDNVITAEEGMILRRISDQTEFGKQVSLGYTYYLGGKLLEERLLELPEHYEEIPIPEEYKEGYMEDEARFANLYAEELSLREAAISTPSEAAPEETPADTAK